ncbi:MAG TPA: fibronectin type III domain-containing protein, partial [Kofleriaceae bacterium]|nr:fibronectin type III domain-containing protein [Kofleriaceae bacterium]
MRWHLRVVVSGLLLLSACTACHRLPMWEGDVPDISPIEGEAFELCGRGKVTEAGGKRLQRPPYLQSVTQTSAVVAWAAWPEKAWVELREASTSEVGGEGEAAAKEEGVVRAEARFGGDPARRERELEHRNDKQSVAPDYFYVQRADLKDLQPDTLYCYQLVSETGPLTQPAPLKTAAAPGHGADDPVRFVMLADTGSGSAAQVAISRRLSATPFDFMVFSGDVAYEQGTASQLQSRFFEIYRDYL